MIGLSTGKIIFLFIIGIILALLVFPVAFFTSILLGYIFGIIAVIISAYMIAKRKGRIPPLALGIVLLVISLVSLVGTATLHMGLYVAQEAMKTKSIKGVIGTPIQANNWRITVTEIKEAEYIKHDNSYYGAKEGQKIVIVTLRVENIGKETESASEIWDFTLVTNVNKSYGRSYITSLEYLPEFELTESIKAKAVKFSEIDLTQSVSPNTYVEGSILFQISLEEEPNELYFKVGIIGGYEVSVKLTP